MNDIYNPISELRIISDFGNIFDTDCGYIIPLYQRAYAWEEKQLTQLIEDIRDITDDSNYYIGTLIVSKQSNKYEVVDGQQRLTSLYLLLNCLGFEVKNSLTFACRKKSNDTLEKIQDLLNDNRDRYDADDIESSIMSGIKIIRALIEADDFNREDFINKLSRVILYRIELPEHTDLNRYFEIMNTRGEQLEQHDILKADLMSALPREEQDAFAGIWDAVSDMTGYVQMHFISKDNQLRTDLFTWEWNRLPPSDWNSYLKAYSNAGYRTTDRSSTIEDIINPDHKIEEFDGEREDGKRVRFESIIEFPFLLLHTLKVFICVNNITSVDDKKQLMPEQTDDKRLIDSFNGVIENGLINNNRIAEDKAGFAREFIVCLLRTRFVFDMYIVKREFTDDNPAGNWSLRCLERLKKEGTYRNTLFIKFRQWESTNDWANKTNLMLQSALRVSYNSAKTMHWLTYLLTWLSENDYAHILSDDKADLDKVTEKFIKQEVIKNFFNVCSDGKFNKGTNTPNVVFNYLDYLLWNRNRNKYSDFVFEFRSSVEHWYPQNPSEGSFDRWEKDEGLDQFGNLCLLQNNINARFSNLSPGSKKESFIDQIAKGSLKLRIMSELTVPHNGMNASEYWKKQGYKAHELEMLKILMDACDVQIEPVFPEIKE